MRRDMGLTKSAAPGPFPTVPAAAPEVAKSSKGLVVTEPEGGGPSGPRPITVRVETMPPAPPSLLVPPPPLPPLPSAPPGVPQVIEPTVKLPPNFDKLPAPKFPDALPAPATTDLKKLKHEEVIVLPQRPTATASQKPAPAPASLPSALQDTATLPAPNFAPSLVPSNAKPMAASSSKTTAAGGETTLTGDVQQFRRGWRLRYASIETEDPNGGSVSITGAGVDFLKEGQRVRITGTLIPSEDRLGTARFQVRRLEVLQP